MSVVILCYAGVSRHRNNQEIRHFLDPTNLDDLEQHHIHRTALYTTWTDRAEVWIRSDFFMQRIFLQFSEKKNYTCCDSVLEPPHCLCEAVSWF